MTELVRCNSCLATYAPIGADGVRYFHACPPLSLPEIEAALATGALELTPAERREVLAGRRTIPRPDARDENVPSTHERSTGQLKAVGLGVTVIADAGDVER